MHILPAQPRRFNPRCLPGAILFVGLLSLAASRASAATTLLMPINQNWRYSTNNLDAENWRAVGYAETGWSNLIPALLYIEGSALPAPKNTPLPPRPGGGPRLTYYFRTTFNVTDAAQVTSLIFSNLIDDGVIFYMNGVEVQRIGMANTNIIYDSLAVRTVGNATTFDIFTIGGDWLTNLVTGNNVLAVEVHQSVASSTDVVFGSALIASTGTSLIRGPYLQNGSHTNLTVRWRTDAFVTGRVRYGTNLANLDLIADGVGNTGEHEIKLTGLLPDTKYFYSVGTATTQLAGNDANHFFVTAPLPGTPKPTRIWIIGDAGTANANQVNVRNAYQNFTGSRPTDLWLMLGDNAYETGQDAEYQAAVFNIYTNQLRHSVLWPALGNHDTAHSGALSDGYPYFNMFTLPKNAEAGGYASGSEHYFSFNYGNIHFICLDSMTDTLRQPGSAMLIWLTNDLADVTADWTIAFWHHPPYTKGSHNSDTESELIDMRENFLPVLEQYGVDLVLSGHSHSYERSCLINGHYTNSTWITVANKLDAGSGRENDTGAYEKPSGGPIGHQGAVYAVVGSSGKISGGSLNHPAMFVSLNNLGSLVVDVSSNRLDAKFLRENGSTNDFFTIQKLNYPPVASNLTFNAAGDVVSSLALAGFDINQDPVSFVTNSLPLHGLLAGLNPVTGAFSYVPAHGFSGNDTFTFRANDGQADSALATVSLTVTAPADGNTSGVPDYWENLFGIADPFADDDTDGFSNAQEYWANTNPTNAASCLEIVAAVCDANGHCTFSWKSTGGTRYRVSYRDGGLGGAFTEIVRSAALEMDPSPIGVESTRGFVDDFSLTGGPPAGGSRFFRVHVVR